MANNTIILLSLISAVISLIYVLCDYYGLTRYMYLHYANYESYIPDYKKLQKADDAHRVIVAFTVKEDELKYLKPFISSILDQTTRVDELAANIPYKMKGKLDKYKDALSIYYYNKDYPDRLGAIIPTLLREGDKNTKIIFVEPYVVYGKDFIENIVEESNKNGENVVNMKWATLLTPDSVDVFSGTEDKNIDEDWLSKYMKWKSVKKNYRENYKCF